MAQVTIMDKMLEQALLFDFYGELLTEHQKQIFEDVVLNDYSLTEVAQERHISRQGVYDIIRRCEASLHDYEAKLGLVARFEQTRSMVREIRQLAEEFRRSGDPGCVEKIAEISEQIGEL